MGLVRSMSSLGTGVVCRLYEQVKSSQESACFGEPFGRFSWSQMANLQARFRWRGECVVNIPYADEDMQIARGKGWRSFAVTNVRLGIGGC